MRRNPTDLEKTMTARQVSGNPPASYDSLLGSHPDSWQLYLLKNNTQVISLKLVATEAQDDKANYWLMYSLRLGRIIRSRDAGLLADHRPELYEWVVEKARAAAQGRAPSKSSETASFPTGWEQMPHAEIADEGGSDWAVILLVPTGWPWVNLKLAYIETEPRPGRANLSLSWNLAETRWAENADYADALSDPDLGEPLLDKLRALIASWVKQYPLLFPEQSLFS